MKKPLEIDMMAGSQLRDTQGEMLSVEGADISELEAGRGRLNDNHGVGFFNSVGRITGAKKILKAEDCENDRHRYYWEKVKAPYIYVKGELYDNDDHPNARAAAAIIRNIHKVDAPLRMKASVEGGVIARGMADPNLLARTKIHSVALTFTPANNATLVEPLNLDKSSASWESDLYIIKSVMHLAKTDVPSFRHITRMASAEKIADNIKKANLLAQQVGFTPFSVEPTADQLIKYALEKKIVDNVAKINNLVKELSKNRSLNATHPSFTQNKNTQSIVKPATNKTSLNKARPNPVTHSYYDIDSSPYTEKDAHKAQMHAIKTVINKDLFPNSPYKTMINEETGKPEVHIAVHRGIGSNFDPDASGENKFKVTDSHIESNSSSVHTLYPSVAREYAGKGGKVISVWVPVSKINALAEYHHAGFKDKRNEIPENMRTEQHMVAPGSKTPGSIDMGDGWTANPKIIPEDVARKDLAHDEHSASQKHISIKPGKFNRISDDEMHKLTKALTAGYGGAGAPGSMTGGSVIQSESLDDGRRGFKYITCDDCGDESVYMKHQVKCRKCNKSYSLAKLLPLMTK